MKAQRLHALFSVTQGGQFFSYDIDSSGDILVLLGPSGSGKSTFLKGLLGTIKVSGFIKSSQIWMSTKEAIFLPLEKRPLAWVPQLRFLFPHLSVLDNIRFGLEKESAKERLDELVAAFEIEHLLEKNVNSISGGEGQRVAIARALLAICQFTEGGFLLLDEPYASLDEELEQKISGLVLDWCLQRGIKTVFSVHQSDRIGDFSRLSDVKIDAYKLVQKGKGLKTERLAFPSSLKGV